MSSIPSTRPDRTVQPRHSAYPSGQGAGNSLRQAIHGLRAWAARRAAARHRRRLRRQTARELASLSDHTLRDIGIPRGAIWTVADDLVAAVAGGVPERDRAEPAPPAAASMEQFRSPCGAPASAPITVGCG